MSNKPIDMFKIRQLLRLYAEGRGSKFINKATGISRNTVKKYLIQFASLQLTIGRVEAMSDRQMATAFLIVKPKTISSRVAFRSVVACSGGQAQKTRHHQTDDLC